MSRKRRQQSAKSTEAKSIFDDKTVPRSRSVEDKTDPRSRSVEPLDAIDAMLARARKLRQKGEERRAFVTLRQAVNLDETRARSWVLFGAMATELGLDDQAARAFEQARWINAQLGFDGRASVCERLAESAMRDAA
jgi:Tfp pilus assembly protein PilF